MDQTPNIEEIKTTVTNWISHQFDIQNFSVIPSNFEEHELFFKNKEISRKLLFKLVQFEKELKEF